ncbi:acyl-CoA dehydrogenase family protein [Amycolatopsis jejuensis]|uniref:acyl-CoA dehydrogenase family protein n=1 Tax=Amycolatopsis jejuensis TaxID=330084 RepID=UPI00052524F6|nr:acyl-CoA dehydrogenase family protein [Amycolatopsis jejuensis]
MSETELIAEAVGELLRDRCTAEAADEAERVGWAPELWAELSAHGYCRIGVPESAGGEGGTVAHACTVLEQVGRAGAPLPVAEAGLLGGWLLAAAGLPVPPEPVTTAPAPGVTLQAGRLRGVVHRVPWARAAGQLVMLTGDQVVTVDPKTVPIRPGANLAGEPRDTLVLDGVVPSAVSTVDVTEDDLFVRGALSRAALIAGAAARIREITVRYTGERVQFGRPIGKFQAVAAHLVRIAEAAETAAMACRTAAANAGTGEPSISDVAAAKTVASEAAGLIAAAAHQATGAMGMTREYELGRLTRRLWSWRDEYGGDRMWSVRLGEYLIDSGADALWPALARGALRHPTHT